MSDKEVLQNVLNSRIPATVLGSIIVSQTPYTPTIFGLTTAGAGTYTRQAGYYARVGPLVFVSYYVTTTAHTGTGSAALALPFPVQNVTNIFSSAAVYSSAQAIGFGLARPNTQQLEFFSPNPSIPIAVPAGIGDWLGSVIYLTDAA